MQIIHIKQIQKISRSHLFNKFYIVQLNNSNITLIMSNYMKAKLFSRPESAKTQETYLTLQTQSNFTFSETESLFTKKNFSKTSDFATHVQQLNKKAKFKKFGEALPTIQEKKENQQLRKQTSRPFQRKNSNAKKIIPKGNQQISEPSQNSLKISNLSQKSSVFVQKNKKKLNSLIGTNKKIEKQVDRKQEQAQTKKINFVAFIFNDPLKKKQTKKEINTQKKQQSNPQLDKKNELLELSQYVSARQLNNMQFWPAGYQNMISQAQKRIKTGNREEIQKIKIQDFKNQFSQSNFNTILQKIKQLDIQLEDIQKKQAVYKKDQNMEQKQSELFELSDDSNLNILSQSSLKELQKRNNLFLTQILKGNLSKQDIQNLQNIQKSHIKLIKLQQNKDQEQIQQQDITLYAKKIKNNNFIQKNKIQANGGLYRQCDYLNQNQKKRLQQLMKNIQGGFETIQNPFSENQETKMHIKRLDQGIQLYKSTFNIEDSNQPVIYEENLPKDPNLRRESELKILKQKIKNVNNGLINVCKIPVDKYKIQRLIKKIEEMNIAKPKSQLIEAKRQQFQEISKKMNQVSQFLDLNTQSNKEQIQFTLAQLKTRFLKLQKDINQIQNYSNQELKALEMQQLNDTRQQLKKLEQFTLSINQNIQNLEKYSRKLKIKINQIDQFSEFKFQNIICQNFKQFQSIQDIDRLITKKYTQNHTNQS